MRVVKTRFPQRPPGEAVELAAARTLREDRSCKRDVALQHPREAVAHFVGRLSDRYGAGNVGRAVDILPAGIDQIQRALLQLAVGLFARAVMDNRAVRAGTG